MVFKHQEFADGFMYELSMPMHRPQPIYPHPDLIMTFFTGYWIGAFEEEHTNYLTMWLPLDEHRVLFPSGPPPYRFYNEADRAKSREIYQRWIALGREAAEFCPPPHRTGPIKLVQIEQAVRESGPQQ